MSLTNEIMYSPARQVCIVTGGARGLGAEFCNAFLKSGCTSLAIMDLKEEEAVNTGQELVKAACGASRLSITLSLVSLYHPYPYTSPSPPRPPSTPR